MASLAILFAGVLVSGVFVYYGEKDYVELFLFVLVIALCVRVFIKYYVDTHIGVKLEKFANYYVIASFVLGLDFSFFTLMHYDLENTDLRVFLTVINFGLITAAVATLAVWIKAYLAFSLPQILALFAVYLLNGNYTVALANIVFTIFMLKVAFNFSNKFKEGRLLINENIKLISDMKIEINSRQRAQMELEEHKTKLEGMVKERTKELEQINLNLNNQIEMRGVIEKELEFLAYYDAITSLPNRTFFIEEAKRSLLLAKRNESLISILFVDLDRFKNINDSHGHDVGDKLLIKVANRLRSVLRDSDIVARNGGDEFAILLENTKGIQEPFVVANKIIESMNEKFEIDGHIIHIGASIGISTYPLDSDNAPELLKMADTAMYEAKKIGRNNFQFYSSAMSNQIADKLLLETALHAAHENNEFYLVYQPQVNALTNETIGFEALIRWNSPEFGLVPPSKFIPILEETGLIYKVGEWVITTVIDFIKSGLSNGKKVSINLSALQCGADNCFKNIKNLITNSNVDPRLLEFEITESILIGDFTKTETFLSDINNIGCTIALDDFGTGYTSFAYITKLPIDIIKIDRSLITNIHTNHNLQDIVRAIVTMCKSLDIENVFEGVETKDELDMVMQLNDKAVIQGYYFSKPLDTEAVNEWILTTK